jgi:hypothetical protein
MSPELEVLNPELWELITMAILAHNSSHAGEFLDCEEADCMDLGIDLLECVRMDLLCRALGDEMLRGAA